MDQLPDIPNVEPANSESELVPITRIGVETELSKYPVHNLARTGKVDIRIIKKKPDGQIELRWEVSYSERYGQARQLAYRLDTIIINRRIDEEGRPLPRLLKLGSLTQICTELGTSESGRNKAIVRKGLLQNASAFITAKLKYRTNDGAERTLEAGFTRYNVVFTGEQLPDGQVADGVYLILNEPFREVLNSAPIRPLNYEYLRALLPAPQRFYEIISSRIYATIKNKNPFARIAYSEFCTYSALTRHFDHENFRVQMSKILRPHLKSGYIARAHYEETVDAEGKIDWMMCYTPGPRARAEYMTFARKSKQLEAKAELAAQEQVEGKQGPASGRADGEPGLVEAEPASPNDELLAELLKRGVTAIRAKKIVGELTETQHAFDQLEWGDYLIQSEPHQYKNPAGFYVYLVSNNVLPPATFESSRHRKLREHSQKAAQAEFLERQQLEEAYEEFCRKEIDRFIREKLTDAEVHRIQLAKRKQLASQIANFGLMSSENVERLLWGALRAEVRPKVTFLTFNEYRVQRSRQPGLFQEQPGQGSQTVPVISDEELQARFAAYCREQAQAATAALDIMERSRRLRAVRVHLLTEHPNREHYQHLMAAESYEEFYKISEEQLVDDVQASLNLPTYEVWKKTLSHPQTSDVR